MLCFTSTASSLRSIFRRAHTSAYGIDYTTRLGGLVIAFLHTTEDVLGATMPLIISSEQRGLPKVNIGKHPTLY